MHKLFYVVIYRHKDNVMERVILTALDVDAAKREVLADREQGWKAEHAMFVCETPTETYLEV